MREKRACGFISCVLIFVMGVIAAGLISFTFKPSVYADDFAQTPCADSPDDDLWLRYEAEEGRIVGEGMAKTAGVGYSGRGYVDNFFGVGFYTNIEEAGIYNIRIRYATVNIADAVAVICNNVYAGQLSVNQPTSTWGTYTNSSTLKISLYKGINYIAAVRYRNETTHTLRFDCMEISKKADIFDAAYRADDVYGTPYGGIVYEAEAVNDFVLRASGINIGESDSASSGKFAQLNITEDKIDVNMVSFVPMDWKDAAETTAYPTKFRIYYATESATGLNFTVNGATSVLSLNKRLGGGIFTDADGRTYIESNEVCLKTRGNTFSVGYKDAPVDIDSIEWMQPGAEEGYSRYETELYEIEGAMPVNADYNKIKKKDSEFVLYHTVSGFGHSEIKDYSPRYNVYVPEDGVYALRFSYNHNLTGEKALRFVINGQEVYSSGDFPPIAPDEWRDWGEFRPSGLFTDATEGLPLRKGWNKVNLMRIGNYRLDYFEIGERLRDYPAELDFDYPDGKLNANRNALLYYAVENNHSDCSVGGSEVTLDKASSSLTFVIKAVPNMNYKLRLYYKNTAPDAKLSFKIGNGNLTDAALSDTSGDSAIHEIDYSAATGNTKFLLNYANAPVAIEKIELLYPNASKDYIRYEAEDGRLSGGLKFEEGKNVSGTGHIKDFNTPEDKLTFSVNAAESGYYNLRVKFNIGNGMHAIHQFDINNGTYTAEYANSGGVWSVFGEQDITLPISVKLYAGENIITVCKKAGTEGYGRIDFIEIGTDKTAALMNDADIVSVDFNDSFAFYKKTISAEDFDIDNAVTVGLLPPDYELLPTSIEQMTVTLTQDKNSSYSLVYDALTKVVTITVTAEDRVTVKVYTVKFEEETPVLTAIDNPYDIVVLIGKEYTLPTEVTGRYNDGRSRTIEIEESMWKHSIDVNTVADYTVTATIEGFAVTFTVSVKAEVIVSIKKPADIIIERNAKYTLYGTVTAVFSDGTEKNINVPNGTWIHNINSAVPGNYTVKAEIAGIDVEFTVTVKVPELVSVTPPADISILKNGVYTLPASVNGLYSDGSVSDVAIALWTHSIDASTPGEYSVTADIDGIAVSFKVIVMAPVAVSIEKPEDITIKINGKYTLPDKVNVVYNDGVKIETDVVWIDGTNVAKAGEYIVSATVAGISVSFTVTVRGSGGCAGAGAVAATGGFGGTAFLIVFIFVIPTAVKTKFIPREGKR